MLLNVDLLTLMDLLPIDFDIGVFLEFGFDNDLLGLWEWSGFNLRLELLCVTDFLIVILFLLLSLQLHFLHLTVPRVDVTSFGFLISGVGYNYEITIILCWHLRTLEFRCVRSAGYYWSACRCRWSRRLNLSCAYSGCHDILKIAACT